MLPLGGIEDILDIGAEHEVPPVAVLLQGKLMHTTHNHRYRLKRLRWDVSYDEHGELHLVLLYIITCNYMYNGWRNEA